MVGVNVTPCNWGVLFAPRAGVSYKYDKESAEVNEIFCTDCEESNRSGISKSTRSEST